MLFDPTLSLSDNIKNLMAEDDIKDAITKKVMEATEYYTSCRRSNGGTYTNEDIFIAINRLFNAFDGEFQEDFSEELKSKYSIIGLLLDFID